MTTAVVPTGGRASVLRDLTTRRDKAMNFLYAAEADHDERRWRRATERFWLRELQLDYLQKMPASTLCANCAMGDEDWHPDLLTGTLPVWSCLQHWTPALEREAAQMAAEARWMGGTD